MNEIYKKKTFLITGATGGLANEFLNQINNPNYNFLLIGRNKKKLDNLKKKFKKNIKIFQCDFENLKKIEGLVRKIKSKENGIDIIINFVGSFEYTPINKININNINKNFNINCLATILINSSFFQKMQKKRFARIINIGSSSSYNGFKDTSLYCASKHALLGFSRSMQDENKNRNLKIIDILPGSIKTKMGRKVRNQDYNDFLEPKAIINVIRNLMNDDSNLKINEIKIKR